MSDKKNSLLAFIPFSVLSLVAGAYNILKIDEFGRKSLLLNTIPICALGMLMMSIGVFVRSVMEIN